jgi:hypothetical protein
MALNRQSPRCSPRVQPPPNRHVVARSQHPSFARQPPPIARARRVTPGIPSSEHVFWCSPLHDRRLVTSDGHALTRLRRALERGSANQIRAIAAELPRPPDLEDALAICLALLDREPETYPRAAAKWASRFAIERRLTFTDAQLVLSALAVLPGEGARAGRRSADRARQPGTGYSASTSFSAVGLNAAQSVRRPRIAKNALRVWCPFGAHRAVKPTSPAQRKRGFAALHER